MTFDDITGDRKLWAVHFEGEDDNEFYKGVQQLGRRGLATHFLQGEH